MKAIQHNKMSMSDGNLTPGNGQTTECLERPPAAEAGKRRRAEEPVAEAHQLLQAILDNIPDRVYFKDTQSRFVKLSKALADRLGVKDPNLAVGKTDFDFNLSKQAKEFYQDEQRVMRTGQPLINKTERQVLPNGEIGWTSTTKVPLRDKEGKVIGLVGINRDITEQKRAEEALRQSYEELEKRVAERTAELAQERLLLRTLIDNLPDCIYAKDTAGRKILANAADLKNLRCKTEAEAIGKTDFDLFPRDLAEKFWADDQKVIQGQPVINREEYVVNAEGKKRWLLTSKLPLRDQNGKIVGLVGMGQDITERRRAEETLVRERLLLRTLIDNLPDFIYAKDKEGRFVLNNLAHAKSLGAKSPEEMKGKSDFDCFPRELAEQFYNDEQNIIKTGKPVLNQEQYKVSPGDKSGQKRWSVTSKVLWRDDKGNILGTVGVTRDITERKQAEEVLARERLLLRTLIDNLPDFIYAKDKEGRFVLNNLAHAKSLGAKLPEEMKSKSDFDFFPRELAEQFYNDEQNIIKTGKPVLNQEQYKVSPGDKSGQKRWSVISKVLWRDNDGNVLGTVGITHNIHEFKLVQEALRDSEAKLRQFTTQLERSNRELQDFAYVASHDLQEPLRKIVVFGERLKEKGGEELDVESRDYLERMQKAASRMQTLINDLLTFSRVTTKAQPFTQVDLAEVAREVVNDLEGRIELVKGRVEVGTLPLIDAEPLQMRQLLQNLIGNALKFRRPDTPPVVKVAAEIITGPAPDGGTGIARKLCRLTVSDNGIGFDEKYLDRIFNVFQRLHSRNEYEGTGMGLAIARKIALFHRGDITAKSKPGEGTTFIVTLPVTHPKEPQTTGENHE